LNSVVKEVKAYLRERFPKTGFRVQRQWGESGMLIMISWTDGVSLQEVNRCGVTNKFIIPTSVSVSVSRIYSNEARKWGEEELKRLWSEASIAAMTSWDKDTRVWRLLSTHSFEEAEKP